MGAAVWKFGLAASSLFLLVAAQSSDICGEISGVLKLPSLKSPFKPVTYGNIDDCICQSHISSYVGSNAITSAAVVGSGRNPVSVAINDLFNSCDKQTCHYPAHSVPSCVRGNPCSFTCSDGFTPFPYGRPTQCVCNKPYTVCNGKCGLFKGCASGRPYYKRDLQCDLGKASCPVPGRGGGAMECVDTQTDLESCGGCMIPLFPGHYAAGVDCSSIHGVADVSCIRGQCVVHRCMSGFSPTTLHDSCSKADDDSEIVLGNLY